MSLIKKYVQEENRLQVSTTIDVSHLRVKDIAALTEYAKRDLEHSLGNEIFAKKAALVVDEHFNTGIQTMTASVFAFSREELERSLANAYSEGYKAGLQQGQINAEASRAVAQAESYEAAIDAFVAGLEIGQKHFRRIEP